MLLAAIVALGILTACTSVGPGTIPRDRFQYGQAIGESWKQQMLLNLVGLRYGEAPVFLEVSSIINQYSLEGRVAAGAGFNTSIIGDDTQTVSGSARWVDRPTITYIPLTGAQLTRNLLTPIPPGSIISMVEAGWPVDLVLRLTVRSINGVNNSYSTERTADPEFEPLLGALARLQKSFAVGSRRVPSERGTDLLLIFVADDADDQIVRDLAFVRETLGLEPGAAEIELTAGTIPEHSRQMAINSHSMLEILIDLGSYFELPAEHRESGRAQPAVLPVPNDPSRRPPIEVQTSKERPVAPFVAIQDRGHWYFIDDRDYDSKRSFSFLMILLSLAEAGEQAQGPVITVGAGNF